MPPDTNRKPQSKLKITPIHFKEACEFVSNHHRHHKKPIGHKFSISVCNEQNQIVGVCIVGRPVSRHLDNGWTLEVTRLATDGTNNACSCLYSAAWRVAKHMGYKRLITYILDTEPGTSLSAANWKCVGEAGGGSWNCKTRPRIDKHPTQKKLLFEAR